MVVSRVNNFLTLTQEEIPLKLTMSSMQLRVSRLMRGRLTMTMLHSAVNTKQHWEISLELCCCSICSSTKRQKSTRSKKPRAFRNKFKTTLMATWRSCYRVDRPTFKRQKCYARARRLSTETSSGSWSGPSVSPLPSQRRTSLPIPKSSTLSIAQNMWTLCWKNSSALRTTPTLPKRCKWLRRAGTRWSSNRMCYSES